VSVWSTTCLVCPKLFPDSRLRPEFHALAVTDDAFHTARYSHGPGLAILTSIHSVDRDTFLLSDRSNGVLKLLRTDGTLRRVRMVDEPRTPDDERLVIPCGGLSAQIWPPRRALPAGPGDQDRPRNPEGLQGLLDAGSRIRAPALVQQPADKYFVLLPDGTASVYVGDVDGARQVFVTQVREPAAAQRALTPSVVDDRGRQLYVRDELDEQVSHAGVDVRDDTAHGGLILALGVVEWPVAVAHARDVRTVLAAALGDRDVGAAQHIASQ